MRAEANAWDTRPGDQRGGLMDEFFSLHMRDVARQYIGEAGDDELRSIGDGLQSICRSGSSIAGDSKKLSANVVPTPSGRSFVATAMPDVDSMRDMLTAMVEKRAQKHPLYQNPESTEGENDVVIIQLTNDMDGAGAYLPNTSPGVTHTYKPEVGAEGNTYSLDLLEPRTKMEENGIIGSTVKVSTTRPDGLSEHDLNLHHLQYTLWPDCGVPEDPETLVGLVGLVNDIQDRIPASQIWVHCMAGAGRTGTLISLASLLSNRQAEPKTSKLPSTSRHSDPVYATVDSIRDYRGRQVLTPGQLGLIHDIVDSKNGIPFSSIKRTVPTATATSAPRSCASEAQSGAHSTMSTTATAVA